MTYMFCECAVYTYNRFILQTRLIGRGSDELFFYFYFTRCGTYFTRGDDVILMQAIQHKYDKYVLYGVLTFSDDDPLKYTHTHIYIIYYIGTFILYIILYDR